MADEEESAEVCPDPIVVEYCSVCTFPFEYCEFGPSPAECLAKNGPKSAPPPKASKAAAAAAVATTTAAAATATTATATTAPAAESSEGAPGESTEAGTTASASESAAAEEPEEDADEDKASKKKPKKPKKKVELQPTGIVLTLTSRGKRKFVTGIIGLASYGIDLKQAQKALANKFAASASVVDEDELQLQGDRTRDLEDFLPTKYSQIKADDIKVRVIKDKDAE
eukprot:m.634547 g.634547  ORF g.634547 m.634547 type:complete len:226 (+) comp58302_c2_seq4:51-728(+)